MASSVQREDRTTSRLVHRETSLSPIALRHRCDGPLQPLVPTRARVSSPASPLYVRASQTPRSGDRAPITRLHGGQMTGKGPCFMTQVSRWRRSMAGKRSGEECRRIWIRWPPRAWALAGAARPARARARLSVPVPVSVPVLGILQTRLWSCWMRRRWHDRKRGCRPFAF
ncbi:hypothetical protein CPB86DRAFT_626678 [Serendipita vermifera]|nr:hypothetical protein CPB86DRAFT_626678 [Serendipita vermifera]